MNNLTSGTIVTATDYSKKEYWYQIPEITKDVDTFYIFATDYIMSSFEEGASDYATLDNPELLEGAKLEYRDHATAYADSTNVFAPYYRQSGLRYAGEVIKKTGNFDNALLGLPYEDMTAALDYYFENCNGGRPFILAGHSQGSSMALLLLSRYFKDHPEYYGGEFPFFMACSRFSVKSVSPFSIFQPRYVRLSPGQAVIDFVIFGASPSSLSI